MPTRTYTVRGMDCAHCARDVENSVARLDGVHAVQVTFATGKMTLEGDVAFEVLQERVAALGKSLEPETDAPPSSAASRGGIIGFWLYLLARRETQLAVTGGAIVLLTLLASLIFGLPEAVTGPAYTLGMVIALYPIARSGVNGLIINREFTINLLMTIAAFGAIAIGEYLEAATVIFLFAIGEALEGYTADRARASLHGLLALKPTQAVRLRDGREETIAAADLAVGDRVLVRPGEQIPADGVVEAGVSSVNQAPITGESIPVSKMAGEAVYAGTINGEGALTIRVTRRAADTTLSRIIRLVEEAQSVRAPSQRLIDRFARWYTPAVVVIAVLIALVPPLFFGGPFYDTPAEHGWLYRALSMLVIACPCALVISAPVTVISAIAAAARRGVLIKGGAFLEALGTLRALAFDKTGTLTEGSPAVTGWHALTCPAEDTCPACDDVLALAAAVERGTAHPLGRAVVQAAQQRALVDVSPAAQAVELLAGRGVRGCVNDHTVVVGSHRLFDEAFAHGPDVCDRVAAAEASGQTVMLLADDGQVRGLITLADRVRPASAAAIRELNALGLTTVMLTGDNAAAAQRVGAAVGVDAVRAGLLPEDKVDSIHALRQRYGPVGMVGDGINDTPALAAATVGIAMGGAGSPQALETADIALMADDLTRLPFAIRLARLTRRLIRQNIALAFIMKALFLVLALFGITSLWAAVLADVGMSLVVTLNGMRPLAFERER
ncbi:MAG: heavy metal translocating P-type ATPase [Candidatus Flexifilum sp.]